MEIKKEDSNIEIGRVAPHSLDAERSVLGSMLLDRDSIIVAMEMIKGEDFYYDGHKEIFNAMINIYNRNAPVDLITLTEELKKNDLLEPVGDTIYIAELPNLVSTTANAGYYCKIVEEKSILRSLIKSSNDIIAEGYNGNKEVSEIIDIAEKKIFDITQNRHQEGPESIRSVLMDSLAKIEKMAESDGSLTGVTTGFIDLDNKTSGLQSSDLILVAARPAMGKTAFTMNLARNAALMGGASVAIFSLEMSKDQLVQRMLSSESHIELQKIIHGNIAEDEWVKLINAMGPLSEANMFIDDTPGITLSELRAKCRKLKIEKGIDLVIIDYLQLMSGEGRLESRQQEISEISRGLKALAKEMDCPVVALSQLSRAPEMRSDHRPILSDLRESGAIEQDADIVIFLYRDEYYDEDSDKKNIGELIIAKHRNGPIGTIELVFIGEYTKFLNLERSNITPEQ